MPRECKAELIFAVKHYRDKNTSLQIFRAAKDLSERLIFP